jgi:hypothetical protein
MDRTTRLIEGASYWVDGPTGRERVTLVRLLSERERLNGRGYDCVIRPDQWGQRLDRTDALSAAK